MPFPKGLSAGCPASLPESRHLPPMVLPAGRNRQALKQVLRLRSAAPCSRARPIATHDPVLRKHGSREVMTVAQYSKYFCARLGEESAMNALTSERML